MSIRASDYVRQYAYDPAAQAAGGNQSILDSFASAFADIFAKKNPSKDVTADAVTDFFVSGATPAISAGQVDYASVQAIANDYVSKKYPSPSEQAATDSAQNAAKATSSFLAGFAPYASLAPLNLTPADAADLISLEQTTQANQLGLTSLQRSVNGSTVGDQNGASNPTGGSPANGVGVISKSSRYVVLAGLLVLFIFLKKKH